MRLRPGRNGSVVAPSAGTSLHGAALTVPLGAPAPHRWERSARWHTGSVWSGVGRAADRSGLGGSAGTQEGRSVRTVARHVGVGSVGVPGTPLVAAWSGLAEDPVHLRATDRALALCHATARLADRDLTLEVPLLLALHAVAVVGLGHVASSGTWRPHPRPRGAARSRNTVPVARNATCDAPRGQPGCRSVPHILVAWEAMVLRWMRAVWFVCVDNRSWWFVWFLATNWARSLWSVGRSVTWATVPRSHCTERTRSQTPRSDLDSSTGANAGSVPPSGHAARVCAGGRTRLTGAWRGRGIVSRGDGPSLDSRR